MITAWSCTLVQFPILTLLRSPRMTAPYQMETLSQSSTSPTTVADGATKALLATRGRWSKRLETWRCRDPVEETWMEGKGIEKEGMSTGEGRESRVRGSLFVPRIHVTRRHRTTCKVQCNPSSSTRLWFHNEAKSMPSSTPASVLTKLLVLVRTQRLEARPVQGLAGLPQRLAKRVQPFPNHARHAAACRRIACADVEAV